MKFKMLSHLFLSGVFAAGMLISAEAFSAPEDYAGMDACLKCHPIKGVKKEESLKLFKDNKHAKLDLTCEACHGPGAKHSGMKISDLQNLKKEKKDTSIKIKEVQSGEACLQCHAKGGKDTITLSGDQLVNFLQENVEMMNNKHMTYSDDPSRKVSCNMCHDAHAPVKSDGGIKRDCLVCHNPKTKFGMPVEIAAMADLKCQDCHMPYIVKRETEGKKGNYIHGDARSHLFGISTDPAYKINDGSGKAAVDANGHVRLTVEQTCGACHNSGEHHDMSRDQMLAMAKKIHPEKKE